MQRRSESRCRRTRRAIRPGSRSRSRHADRRPTGPRPRRRRRPPHRSRRAAAPARARARVRAQPARGADSCCRARAIFENLIRHLVRRPVRVDHDDAGNASQPLPLVGGVAASSPHDRLDCVVAWQVRDLAQADHLPRGRRELLRQRVANLGLHPGLEHRLRPLGDPPLERRPSPRRGRRRASDGACRSSRADHAPAGATHPHRRARAPRTTRRRSFGCRAAAASGSSAASRACAASPPRSS